MAVEDLLTQPLTILHRTPMGEDDYGNDVLTVEEVEAIGEIQQTTREEPGSGGEMGTGEWRLFLAPEWSISSGDAVRVAGVEYELVGAPWRVWNPRLREFSHIEASVRLAE